MLGKFSIVATIALSAFVPTAVAFDFVKDGVYYDISQDGKRAIVTYSSLDNNAYSGNVVIPATVNHNGADLKVREIGDDAFITCSGVTSISIPEGVIIIGQQAFSHCSGLKSIVLPSTVYSIGDYAFEYCSALTTIEIPAAVEVFGSGTFMMCEGLRSISVADGNPILRSDGGVLYSADKSVIACFPAASEITELTLPAELEQIDINAFTPAPKLQKIVIGPAVEAVWPSTFSTCNALTEFSVADDNASMKSIDGVLLDKQGKTLMQYPLGIKADAYSVPEGVETLDDMSMASAEINELTLPSSLQRIGEFAVYGIASLTKVTVNAATPPAIVGSDFFPASVTSSAPLIVPEGSVDAYKRASGWKSFKTIRTAGSDGIADITADSNAPVEIFDISGRKVFAGAAADVTVPAPGVYIVRSKNETRKAIF